MTHETKAGIAVSITFLCLASTVMFVRMRPSTLHAESELNSETENAAHSVPPDPVSVQPPAQK